ASIATGGLAVPIGLHAAWNFGDWLRGNKQSNGLWKSVVEQPVQERAQMEGMILYVIVRVLATSAFWWWHHRLWPRRLRPVDSEFASEFMTCAVWWLAWLKARCSRRFPVCRIKAGFNRTGVNRKTLGAQNITPSPELDASNSRSRTLAGNASASRFGK